MFMAVRMVVDQKNFFDFQLKLPELDVNLYVQLLYNSAVSKYKVDSFKVMMTCFK